MTITSRPTRRIPVLVLLPFCLAFAGGAAAGSNGVAMHGPNGNGGGGCDDSPAIAPDAASPKPVPTPAPAVKRGSRVKPVVTIRSGDADDGSAHTPRWHSFLPGMFR